MNSIVSELRANGYVVTCRQAPGEHGRIWLYRLSRESSPGLRGGEPAAGSARQPLAREAGVPARVPGDDWRLTPPPEDP